MVKKIAPTSAQKYVQPKHYALHTALPGCQLLSDSQKRGKSTKDFFSVRKQNGKIFLEFFLVLGYGRKCTHVVRKGVVKRVSKQIGGIGCLKLQYSEGTFLWMGIHEVLTSRILEFYKPYIIIQKFFERSFYY